MRLNLITHEVSKAYNWEKEYKIAKLTFSNQVQSLQYSDYKLAPILPYQQRRRENLPSLRKLKIFRMGHFTYSHLHSTLPSPVNSSFESSSSSPGLKDLDYKYKSSCYSPYDRPDSPEESPHQRMSMSKRTSISKQQTSVLNKYYSLNHYPNQDEKLKLVKLLKLSERTIQIWFQNRRQNRRTKYNFLRD